MISLKACKKVHRLISNTILPFGSGVSMTSFRGGCKAFSLNSFLSLSTALIAISPLGELSMIGIRLGKASRQFKCQPNLSNVYKERIRKCNTGKHSKE